MKKLVQGVGKCDLKICQTVDGKHFYDKAYKAWVSMLQRYYDDKFQERKPTYKGCTVCEEWLTYSNFKLFYDTFYIDGWHLDKDLKVDGNKVYSPTRCVFVPRDLNTLLLDRGAARGEYPKGVSYNKKSGRFQSLCSVNGELKHLGYFTTSEEASEAYQRFKYNHVLGEVKYYRELYSTNKQLMGLLDVLEERYKKLLTSLK